MVSKNKYLFRKSLNIYTTHTHTLKHLFSYYCFLDNIHIYLYTGVYEVKCISAYPNNADKF